MPREHTEVRLEETVMVAVNGPCLSGPTGGKAEVPLPLLRDLRALVVKEDRLYAKVRLTARARFGGRRPGQWCEEMPTRLCLPPRVDDGTTVLTDDRFVPLPRGLVNWFAHRPQHSEVLDEGTAAEVG